VASWLYLRAISACKCTIVVKKVDQYLDNVRQLPPAPTVVLELLALFNDPDRDLGRVVEIIRLDPALTATTLKRCNSPSFAGAPPATDMFEAASRLGSSQVYYVVTALIASRTMTQVRAKYRADATRLWKHTVTTAVIASTLAKRVGETEAEAFTAGLLHDLGKLIFVSVEGITYAELVRKSGGHGLELAAAEESSWGFAHPLLGARLLARWGFPTNICMAVQLHHQPPAKGGQFQDLAAVVNFANSLAHQMIEGLFFAPEARDTSPEAMRLLKLAAKDIPSLVRQVNESLAEAQELLRMLG